MTRLRYELTNFEWSIVEPLLPNTPRGVPRVDDRKVLNGIFWRFVQARPGWKSLSVMARRRPATTASCGGGSWDLGPDFDAITAAYGGDLQMIDSSSIRVHQHGASAKKGAPKPPCDVPLTPDAWGVQEAA